MQNFEGKVAVVTGGASSIGFGMAERFAARGAADDILLGRDPTHSTPIY